MSLRARRPMPRRRDAPRWSVEEWGRETLVLLRRARADCECCGQPLNGRVERHHRKRRRDGGDRLSNVVMLLPEHHTYVTTHPAWAEERGLIVWVEGDPETQPVWWQGKRWVLLDDDGGMTDVDGLLPPVLTEPSPIV